MSSVVYQITCQSTKMVYIGTSDMKLSKEHKRICFGGKTVSKEDAYEIAKQFVTELTISENVLHDSIQCRQQVTA